MPISLADKYVRRTQTLLRAAEGEAIQVAKVIDEVNKKIIARVKLLYKERMTKKEIKYLESQILNDVNSFYKDYLPKELSDIATIAIAREIEWNVETIIDEIGAKKISLPDKQIVAKRAASKTYRGHTFDYWTKREYGKQAKKVKGILRNGFVKSTPLTEVESQLMKITNRPRADVKTLVRSHFMHNAVEAKEKVFGLNPEIVEGAVWLSTLDERTTPLLCGIRDGLEYDQERNPIGHDIPWLDGPGRLHWNCRSISMPKLIGSKIEGNRPSFGVGDNYERGDNTTRTGRVRKHTKDSRDKGIFKFESKTMGTTYESWLREQSRRNINYASDVLGSKKNARLFRDGEVTLKELAMESPVANPLTRKSL